MNYYIIGLLILFVIMEIIFIVVFHNKAYSASIQTINMEGKDYTFINTNTDTNSKDLSNCPATNKISCCTDANGSYKGQVCDDHLYYIADYDKDIGGCNCLKGWQIQSLPNGGHGKKCIGLDKNKIINPGGPILLNKKLCNPYSVDVATCDSGYTGDNCENIIDTQKFTPDQVLNILNNLDYVRNNYASSFENLFDTFPPGTYILVYCIPSTHPLRSKYYNFCSNGATNYYVDKTIPVSKFHDSIYGQDYGDLIYNYNDNVGFWWNSLNGDNCSDHGGEQHYISVKPDGILASLSSYQNNKNQNYNYFENIINKNHYSPPYVDYKNIGVLLIGPEPLSPKK